MQKSLLIESVHPVDFPKAENWAIKVISGNAIDTALLQRWRILQESNPELENPCFAPEFTQAVAAARNDVEVGIIKDGQKSSQFFPSNERLAAMVFRSAELFPIITA